METREGPVVVVGGGFVVVMISPVRAALPGEVVMGEDCLESSDVRHASISLPRLRFTCLGAEES